MLMSIINIKHHIMPRKNIHPWYHDHTLVDRSLVSYHMIMFPRILSFESSCPHDKKLSPLVLKDLRVKTSVNHTQSTILSNELELRWIIFPSPLLCTWVRAQHLNPSFSTTSHRWRWPLSTTSRKRKGQPWF